LATDFSKGDRPEGSAEHLAAYNVEEEVDVALLLLVINVNSLLVLVDDHGEVEKASIL
jgi:hypothetical protein